MILRNILKAIQAVNVVHAIYMLAENNILTIALYIVFTFLTWDN